MNTPMDRLADINWEECWGSVTLDEEEIDSLMWYICHNPINSLRIGIFDGGGIGSRVLMEADGHRCFDITDYSSW